MSGDEALSLMPGQSWGKKVKIMVSRNGVLSEIELNLARKEIKIKTMETTLFDDNMTYRI